MILKNGNNLAPNLEAYWKLNGDANDSIGSRNGTLTGSPSYVAGKLNQSIELLAGQRINFTPLVLPTQWTFNCWFMPLTEDSETYKAIVATNAVNFGFYYQQASNNRLIMYDGVNAYRYNNTNLITNTWNMITFVYNNGTGQWYLNGQIDSILFINVINGNIDQIGGSHTSFNSNERIDEIGFWNRVLLSSDINDLYNQGLGLGLDSFKSSTPTVLMQNYTPLLNDLFSYYPMQNNSNDIIGTNNGTDTSISYVSGKIDQAAQYTTSGNINVGAMPELSGVNKLSIAFWAKSPDLFFPNWIDKSNCIQIRYDGSYQYGIGVYIYESSGADYHYTRNITGSMAPGQWAHIVVTYDGTEALDINKIKIYINGVQCITEQPLGLHLPTMPTSINASVNDLFIGTNLTGNMDEVGFWNRVLSFADVSSLYNSGVGLAYPFYNAVKVSNPFILDQERNTKMAYSVRKLRSKYRGYCLRVRRSNDDAEMDIGFDWKGDLDTTRLMTFVGINSAYVVTWYDQSGNSLDATQIVNANQPQIVNAGVLITRNNKPALYSVNNTKYLNTPLTNFLKEYSLIGVVQFNTSGTEWIGGGGNNYGIYQVSGSGSIYHGYNSTLTGSTGTYAQGLGNITLNTPNVVEIHRTNTVISNAINGTVSAMSQIGLGSVNEFLITTLNGESAGYRLIGYLQETICYDTNKINTRAQIYKNIKNYYN